MSEFEWFRLKNCRYEVNDIPTDKTLQSDDRVYIVQGSRVSSS